MNNFAQPNCPAPPMLKCGQACSWLDKDPPVREYSRRHGFNWPPHIHQVIAWLAIFAVFLCSLGLAHSLLSAPFSLFIGLATTCFLIILALKVSVTLRDSAIPQIRQLHNFYSARRPPFFPGKTASHVIVQKQETPYIGYCHVCQLDVTPGTKHCRQCNKCVAGWDHHCTWLNTCIGINNFNHFLLFVSATFLTTFLFVLYHLVMLLLYFSCAPTCFQPGSPAETTTPSDHQVRTTQLNQSTSTVEISHAVSTSQASHDNVPIVLYFYTAQVPIGVWFFCLLWSLLLCVITLLATGNLVFIYFQLIRKHQSATIFYQLDQQEKQMDQSDHRTLHHLPANITKHFPFLDHLHEKLRPTSTTSPSSKTSVTLTTSESASQSAPATAAHCTTKPVDSIQNTQRLSAETLHLMELTNGTPERLQAGSRRFDHGHYDNLGFQTSQEALRTLNSGDVLSGLSGAPNIRLSSSNFINTSNLNIYHHPNFHRRYNLPFFHSPNIQHWYYPNHPHTSDGPSPSPALSLSSNIHDSAKTTDHLPTKTTLPSSASSIIPSSEPTNTPGCSTEPPILSDDPPSNRIRINTKISPGVKHFYKSMKDSIWSSKMDPSKTNK